jgi:hypothetical protein
MDIQTWTVDKYFLGNEQSESATSRKITKSICQRIKLELLRENNDFGKICSCLFQLASFLLIKHISDETSDNFNSVVIF